MSLCKKCANANCNHAIEPNEVVVQCGAYMPPATNADRIRAMSDEELSKMLTGVPIVFDCTKCEECTMKCDEQCLKWLQQPVEEGGHACKNDM